MWTFSLLPSLQPWQTVINAPGLDVSLRYQAMWISVYMLLLPSVQCQRACLGEKNSKLNINENISVTFPLQLHHRTALKEAGKYKTTKGYHHDAQCLDTHAD